MTSRTRRRQWLGGVAAVAIIVVVAAILLSSGGEAEVKKDRPAPGGAAVAAQFRGIPQRGLILGRSTAPVTLVTYIDLKCPVCRAFEADAFPTIVERYVRTGRVRIQVYPQDFVGNEDGDSENAARMSLAAAEQNRAFQFNALFYRNQGPESTTYVNDDFLTAIGLGVAGLDLDKALEERDSGAIDHQLEESSRQFELQGFTGTPSFQMGTTGGVLSPFTPDSFQDPKAFTGPIDALLKG